MDKYGTNDTELWQAVQRDSREAFGLLFEKYWEYLFEIVYKRIGDEADTKDIVQEIFIYIWKNKARIYVENTLEPFLFSAARNHILALYRRKSIRLAHEKELVRRMGAAEPSDTKLLVWELEATVDRELGKMSPKMSQCYTLNRRQGMSVPEISQLLSLSEQTVRNYISEALDRIRRRLR